MAKKGLNEIKIIGVDVANSTIKVWTDDKHLKYRNTVKEIKDDSLLFSFKTDYHMYVYDSAIYEVGDISSMGAGARGKARYGSNTFKIAALIAVASVLNPEYRHQVKIVTGVPSAYAKDEALLEKIKTSLMGEHSIKSVYWDQMNDIEFEVVDVIVTTQPLGTLYTHVYDEATGEFDEKGISQRALVVDIGWGTTDIAVLDSGRVSSTFGFDLGVSDYISSVQEKVNNDIPKANINSLNAHELDMKLIESPVVETPFGTFDLGQYAELCSDDMVERIYAEVMSLGLEFNKFYKIIMTGGGSQLFSSKLKAKFDDPRLIVDENPVLANAHGFYLLGKSNS